MRYLITLFLLSFSILVSSQEVRWVQTLPLTDTIKWMENRYTNLRAWSPSELDSIAAANTIERVDTSVVLILVSDTSNYEKIITWQYSEGVFYDTVYYKKRDTYWVQGYIVKEQTWECCDPSDNQSASYYWVTNKTEYLDAEKKRLSPNIIVWQSR